MSKKSNSMFPSLTCTELFPAHLLSEFKVSPKLESIMACNELEGGVLVSSNARIPSFESGGITNITFDSKDSKDNVTPISMVTNVKLNNVIEVRSFHSPKYFAYLINKSKQIMILHFHFLSVILGNNEKGLFPYIDESRTVPTIGFSSVDAALAKWYDLEDIINPGMVSYDDTKRLTEYLYTTQCHPFQCGRMTRTSKNFRVRVFNIEDVHCEVDVNPFMNFIEINDIHKRIIPDVITRNRSYRNMFTADFDGDSEGSIKL